MNAGYAFEFPGHGVFTPDGKADMSAEQVAEHNRQLEAAELAAWSERPDRWVVYVTGSGGSARGKFPPCPRPGDRVTTWTGRELGTLTVTTNFIHNFGSRMTAIRFRGTNGAEYYGRYGSDWSEACRVRKVKGGAS